MSEKLMTFHTHIIFRCRHSYRIQMEVTMNSLILISLSICEFFETQSFSITFGVYFVLLYIFALISKNITINKNNIPKGLI